MNRKKLKEAPWYSYAVAGCIAVVLLVVLIRLPELWRSIRKFVNFFRPVIWGCVIAYIVNPLAKFFARTIFSKIRRERVQVLLSNALAFLVVILFLSFFVVILIPQLIDSIGMFANNLDGYIESITAMLERWSITSRFDISQWISSYENLIDRAGEYITENISSILEATASAGKGLVQWVIAFILSIYLLGDKKKLKGGLKRLFVAVFGEKRFAGIGSFLSKCNDIFNRYIVFNLIDSLIIGVTTAIFMGAFRMQYVGLIAFVVAVTNLVPTFGPVVGAAIGGFILLMVRPVHALIFIIFTLVLQTLDGYVIKPKLFGNSLGVSGLWILIGVIVGGNMFGVVGILLAIPVVAILDLLYSDYFLPWLEKRRRKKEQQKEALPEGQKPAETEAESPGVPEEQKPAETEEQQLI